MRLTPARGLAGLAAFWTAQTWIGPVSQRPYACWDARAGVARGGVCAHQGCVCGPSPEPGPHGRARHAQPAVCVGREEGQHAVSVAEANTNGALHSPCQWRLHRTTGVVQPRVVGTCART